MRKTQQTRSLVAAWFDFLPPGQVTVARDIYKAIRSAAPECTEVVRQGNLLLSMDGEALLALSTAPHRIELLVFNGSELDDEVPGLEAHGRRQRKIGYACDTPVDLDQVGRIARASAAAARRA